MVWKGDRESRVARERIIPMLRSPCKSPPNAKQPENRKEPRNEQTVDLQRKGTYEETVSPFIELTLGKDNSQRREKRGEKKRE